jgi:hypothetical protein
MFAVRHLAAADMPAVRLTADGVPGYLSAAFFVDPPATLLLHNSASAAIAASYRRGLREVLAYLGRPL